MLKSISQSKVFNGWHKQYLHTSVSNNCDMKFAIYLPATATPANRIPVLYWLSGLTCTDENFMQKAGAFQIASKLGIAIVAPNSSPRGELVHDDENYDLGQGASFYVNATQKPWSENYHMYDYVVKELPLLIEKNFPVSSIKSIAGHSMGGHGALVIALRNQDAYRSVSAFSPIVNPMNSPWGQKAFSTYLGINKETWKRYDTSELMQNANNTPPILIDQGEADQFLNEQLKTHLLYPFIEQNDSSVVIRMHPGYDHSYFFISSFIDEHFKFHAQHLTSVLNTE